MIETLDHVRFDREALDHQITLDGVGDVLDLLDRPLLVQRRIQRQIDGRHTALADLRQDAVTLADKRVFSHHTRGPFSTSHL